MARPVNLKPWRRLDTEMVYRCRVFSLRRDRSVSPRTGSEHDFFVLDACDWVNVVPLTADERVVMIRQYRHGIGDFTLEIPGGMVDPGESPAQAAARELLEETGYRADRIVALGSVSPNPALFANRLHSFLAEGCERVAEVANDHAEETVVELVARADVRRLLAEGAIDHALVMAAFHFWSLRGEG